MPLQMRVAAESRVVGQAEEKKGTTKTDKAVKSDDAAAPVFLWNEAVCVAAWIEPRPAMQALRRP
jgi:hypothetical protein